MATVPERPRYPKEEFARQGDEIYERDIAPRLEKEDEGKFILIDIESGDYEVDADEDVASDRLLARRPDAQIWFRRIGDRYVRRFRLLSDEASSVEPIAPPQGTRSTAKDVDRTPEFRWLSEHGKEYLGRWVALSGEELVAHSATLKELVAELEPKNLLRKPLIHKIEEIADAYTRSLPQGARYPLRGKPLQYDDPTGSVMEPNRDVLKTTAGNGYTDEEVARRGDEIYERDISFHLKGEDEGKFIFIDIESGDYEIDTNEFAASDRLRTRRPDAEVWIRRVGSRYAYRL